MFYLKAESSFDAAHFLAHYEGKCHNIHGHHWIVQLRVCGEALQDTVQERGMLVDASYGRKTKAVLLMDTDHVILSAMTPDVLSEWWEATHKEVQE